MLLRYSKTQAEHTIDSQKNSSRGYAPYPARALGLCLIAPHPIKPPPRTPLWGFTRLSARVATLALCARCPPAACGSKAAMCAAPRAAHARLCAWRGSFLPPLCACCPPRSPPSLRACCPLLSSLRALLATLPLCARAAPTLSGRVPSTIQNSGPQNTVNNCSKQPSPDREQASPGVCAVCGVQCGHVCVRGLSNE